jgi:hypothetical protein
MTSRKLITAGLIFIALTRNVFAVDQDKTPPVLVVWARTDLANCGQPTLDLIDLERYFVARLGERYIPTAYPSTTTKIPTPPPTNFYLVELSVNALQEAERAQSINNSDGTHSYYSVGIFHVELAASVKHLSSGEIHGPVIVRYEHQFVHGDGAVHAKFLEKRAAIVAAADELADKLVDAISSGGMGTQLETLGIPFWATWSDWQKAGAIRGALFVLLILVIVIAWVTARSPKAPRISGSVSAPRYDKRLDDAQDIMLETNNHSDAWYAAAAKTKRQEILNGAAEVRRKEAERRIRAKDIQAEYEVIADYATAKYGLDRNTVVEMLRKVDAREFRLLQLALEPVEESINVAK